MFKTNLGPVEDDSSFAYLRPRPHSPYSPTSRTSWTPLRRDYLSVSPRSARRSAMKSLHATSSSGSASSSRWSSSSSSNPVPTRTGTTLGGGPTRLVAAAGHQRQQPQTSACARGRACPLFEGHGGRDVPVSPRPGGTRRNSQSNGLRPRLAHQEPTRPRHRRKGPGERRIERPASGAGSGRSPLERSPMSSSPPPGSIGACLPC